MRLTFLIFDNKEMINKTHEYKTRSKLEIPITAKTNDYINKILDEATIRWNKLKYNIKKIEDRNKFKEEIIKKSIETYKN